MKTVLDSQGGGGTLRQPLELHKFAHPAEDAIMFRCANPTCGVPRTSFCDGRLFQFEIVAISVAANDDTSEPFDEKPERKITHCWLCDSCASKMSVTLDPMQGLRVVPREEEREGGVIAQTRHGNKLQPRNPC